MKKKILVCVGTRPNFIKVVRLRRLLTENGFDFVLLHTGQHFDTAMSDVFFEQLKLGQPDYCLEIQGGDINQVTSRLISEIDLVLKKETPDLAVAVGDVTSTFALAYSAAVLGTPVAHIESGLRSRRMSMPEERNRILTDNLSSLLFVTEQAGITNLLNEGIESSKIKLVGNTMIDALVDMHSIIESSAILEQLKLNNIEYCLCTFHRPINVDSVNNLEIVCDIIQEISKNYKVIFPIHPHTRMKLEEFNLWSKIERKGNIVLTEPQGYIEFLSLLSKSKMIVTDSGGIQSEASFLNIPCITLRDETELKSTIELGTNTLCNLKLESFREIFMKINSGTYKKKANAQIWDGMASERIVDEIIKFFKN